MWITWSHAPFCKNVCSMEPLQTDSVLPLGASQSKQNKRRKQRGIMGVVVLAAKQPPLWFKICLRDKGRKYSQTSEWFTVLFTLCSVTHSVTSLLGVLSSDSRALKWKLVGSLEVSSAHAVWATQHGRSGWFHSGEVELRGFMHDWAAFTGMNRANVSTQVNNMYILQRSWHF